MAKNINLCRRIKNMSYKDIQKGLEIGAKPLPSYMQKQAEATREVGRRVIQKVDDLGNIVEVVVDDLNAQEKERLYRLKSEFKIKDLDENEKDVLVSALYTLLSKHEQNSTQQQEYFSAVRKYLKIENPNPDFDLEKVENIDSVAQTKAIYSVVCEFLFLKHCDHSYQEQFSDFLECFNIRQKAVAEIVDTVDFMYETLGLQGIVGHYDLSFDAKVDSLLNSGNDDLSSSEVDIDGLTNLSKTKFKINTNNLSDYSLENVYNNPYEISGKRIHINGNTCICSSLVIKDCIIIYALETGGKITLDTDATLRFVNCQFQCTKRIEDSSDCLITSMNQTNANQLAFINCHFESCQNVVRNISAKEFLIDKCFFIKPISFIYQSNLAAIKNDVDNCIIKDSIILINNKNGNVIFDLHTGTFSNNLFFGIEKKESEDLMSALFSRSGVLSIGSDEGRIENCTFYRVDGCTEGCGDVTKCEFIECKNVLNGYNEHISESVFYKCKKVITNSSSFGSHIKFCEFLSCKDVLPSYNTTDFTIEHCIFKNVASRKQSLFNIRLSAKYARTCIIRNCTFDDIALGNNYLLECTVDDGKLKRKDLILENCRFSNIHLQRTDKSFIKKTAVCKVFLGTENVQVVFPSNCVGLENGDHDKLSKTDLTYNKLRNGSTLIGANFSDAFLKDISVILQTSENVSDHYYVLSADEMLRKVYTLICDFLEKETGGKLLVDIGEVDAQKTFLAFQVEKELRKKSNLIGRYNASLSLRETFHEEESGILFLKDRYYCRQSFKDSQVQSMMYSDLCNRSAINLKGGLYSNVDSLLRDIKKVMQQGKDQGYYQELQDFNQKQTEATREVERRVIQKIDDLGNRINVILADLNAMEEENENPEGKDMRNKDTIEDIKKQSVQSSPKTVSKADQDFIRWLTKEE